MRQNSSNVHVRVSVTNFSWFPKFLMLLVFSCMAFFSGLVLRGLVTWMTGTEETVLVVFADFLLTFGGYGFLFSVLGLLIFVISFFAQLKKIQREAYRSQQHHPKEDIEEVEYYIEEKKD